MPPAINPKVDLVNKQSKDKKSGKKTKKPQQQPQQAVTADLHFELLYGNYQVKEKDREGSKSSIVTTIVIGK